jgi:hypothetical protein
MTLSLKCASFSALKRSFRAMNVEPSLPDAGQALVAAPSMLWLPWRRAPSQNGAGDSEASCQPNPSTTDLRPLRIAFE